MNWTANDLNIGDWVVCEDMDDRDRMQMVLSAEGISTSSDIRLIGDEYRMVLYVNSGAKHKVVSSSEYSGRKA